MSERVGVGVGAVIVRGGAVLMQQRTGSHGAGLWSVPGGWQERGETVPEAAEREVLEETGVVARAVGSWGPGWTSGTLEQVGAYSVTCWVECLYVAGEPVVREPDKCLVVAWVPLDQVVRLPLFWPTGQVAHLLGAEGLVRG